MLCDKCKHADGCPAKAEHGGALRCSAFKSQEQTNEEWLHSLNTEQLADWLARITNAGYLLALRMKYHCDDVDAVREWLKQPHTDN